MKTVLAFSLVVVAAVCQLSCAVTVTEGDYRFSLEAVEQLGKLMGGVDVDTLSLRLVEVRAQALCASPAMPRDFLPLCRSANAGLSLARLALVASHMDACEICESVACTGC